MEIVDDQRLHILSERKLGRKLRKKLVIRHISLIRGFRPRQQFGHFGLQPGLDLAGMFIGQRAVPVGIGVDRGAVQSHYAQSEQPHLAITRALVRHRRCKKGGGCPIC
jgi:hypothetical protein